MAKYLQKFLEGFLKLYFPIFNICKKGFPNVRIVSYNTSFGDNDFKFKFTVSCYSSQEIILTVAHKPRAHGNSVFSSTEFL